MNIRTFIAICAFLLAGSPAIAGTQGQRAAGIDPEIWLLRSGGMWVKNDHEYGNYRVYVKNSGWEHTQSFLYLQWLGSDDSKQQVTVVKTIPIPEFNESGWYNVIDIKRNDNAFVIIFTARGHEEAQRTAVLSPGLPGKYRFIFE
jgi:hypothetical protein